MPETKLCTCPLPNTEKAVDIHRHYKSEVVYIVNWKADTVELYVRATPILQYCFMCTCDAEVQLLSSL